MERVRINKTFVQSVAQPKTGQVIYRDEALPGFALRVTAGSKTFIVEKWNSLKAKAIRATIGKYPAISAEKARKKAGDMLAEITVGVDINEEKRKARAKDEIDGRTLAYAWQEYQRVRELRPSTLRVYSFNLKNYFHDWLDLPLSSISSEMVTERYLQIVDPRNAGARSSKDGAKAQGHQAVRTLRAIFSWAQATYRYEDGRPLIKEVPTDVLIKTKGLKRVDRRKGYIKGHQLSSWFGAVLKLENTIVRDLLLLCILTGLRRQEATGLRWSEIDMKAGTLTIPPERSKTKEELVQPFSDVLLALLSSRVRHLNSPFVFPGKGKSGHIVEPKRAVEKVIAETATPEEPDGISFIMHDLRRTFATVGESVDIPFLVLKKLLNHKINDQTAQYAQVNDIERLRGAMQRISDAMLELAKIDKDDLYSTLGYKGEEKSPRAKDA